MKTLRLSALLLSIITGAGLAHADTMNGAGMQNKPMKDMATPGQMAGKTHHAVGIVKKVDMGRSRVTIAHGAVASLHWPAMTMSFAVKDKKLFDVLAEGKKVEFDFIQEDGASTIVFAK